MQLTRQVKHSLHDHVAGLFRDPQPDSRFSRPFNVYGLRELEKMNNNLKQFTPVRPFIFLVDQWQRFLETQRPAIIIDWQGTTRFHLEMGNPTRSHLYAVTLRIFGRYLAESEDFADYVASHLLFFPVYDYDQSPPVILANAVVEEDIFLQPDSADTDTQTEGRMGHWVNVGFAFEVFPL